MNRIVGIKFKDYGQVYFFDCAGHEFSEGDWVLVETDQGRGIGYVASLHETAPEDVAPEEIKPVIAPATDSDFTQKEENDALGRQAHRFCREKINERRLEMKLVEVEVFYDKSKIIFYFTAPGRVDFRELVKDLVREYRTRIELRQIGVRHETQMIGAVGNCGQLCCCRRFLRKFDPVTIKMAKEQNLFLNPTKISGICGRLLCCLGYEQHNYEEFQRRCPRIGRRFRTVIGNVKVLRSNFFRETITVLTEGNEEREISLDEWLEMSAPRAGGESFENARPVNEAPHPPQPRPSASGDSEDGESGESEEDGAATDVEAPDTAQAESPQSGAEGAGNDREGAEAKRSGEPRPERQGDREGRGPGRSGRGRRPRRRGGRRGPEGGADGGGQKSES